MRRCEACRFASKLSPRSSAYHRLHRENHLAVFPNVDKATRDALDVLVSVFELREQGDTVVVSVD